MKNISIYKLLLLFVLVSIFSGCELFNNDDPTQEDKYLVTFDKHASYTVSQIQSLLNLYVFFNPELKIIADNLQNGIDVYTITYNTKFEGKDIIASGLVSVPDNAGTFPVLSYQNGTNTLNSEAPSVNPDNEMFKILEFVSSTGFIVSMPDYIGFGSTKTKFHPYLDKESTVQTVTDMIRAVNELVTNYSDIEVSKDLYIAGYSQGGWATLHLQKEIEQKYATEFNLKASACGAGPYDLRYINDYILAQTNYPMPYFIGYMFNSYFNLKDITNPPSDVFKSPYDARVLTLYDGTKSGEEINAQLTTVTTDLFTAEYKSSSNTNAKFSSVISTLGKNTISAWKTTTPTLIMHGTTDNYVPTQVSADIYQDFLTAGVSPTTVTYVPIEGAGHNSGVMPFGIATINWFIGLNNKESL